MAKIWVLERFITKEEELSYLKNFKENIIEDFKDNEKFPEIMADVNSRIENAKDYWTPVLWNINYFNFCSKVKDILKEADNKEIDKLKESLGEVKYCPEVNSKFRETHQAVKSSYRVMVAQDFEGDAKNEFVAPKFIGIEENTGVYNYLWNSTSSYKGKSR